MPMRDYENLKDITIPPEQKAIMSIIVEAWEECHESNCTNCPDRLKKFMSIMECHSLKYSRKLMEAGYAPVVHGEWIHNPKREYDYICSVCRGDAPEDRMRNNAILTPYCPHCGAVMDGGKKG